MSYGLRAAVNATLRDLINSSTNCGCCDNDRDHAALIERALQRFEVELWPSADMMPPAYTTNPAYARVREALLTRKAAW